MAACRGLFTLTRNIRLNSMYK